MKLLLALLLAHAPSAFAGDVTQGPQGVTVADLVSAAQAERSLPAALDAAGAKLVGTPYVLGNAGEGEADVFDQDPLWRLDVQDCTTYIETVMASVLARDADDFVPRLLRVRYEDGKVSFRTRNHFPETDWLPNNERAGFVRDVTRELFPELARSVTVTIDKPLWYSKMTADSVQPVSRPLEERERLAATLRGFAGLYQPEAATIAYLPITSFYVRDESGELQPNRDVLARIPNATIFNVTREGWAPGGLSMAISHQGFVIQKADGTYIRHASTNRAVVEDRLDVYFKRFLEGSTVRGINLLEVLAPASSR